MSDDEFYYNSDIENNIEQKSRGYGRGNIRGYRRGKGNRRGYRGRGRGRGSGGFRGNRGRGGFRGNRGNRGRGGFRGNRGNKRGSYNKTVGNTFFNNSNDSSPNKYSFSSQYSYTSIDYHPYSSTNKSKNFSKKYK